VFAQRAFLKEYTYIHLKQCSLVDVEFTIIKNEADSMKYLLNDGKNQILILCDTWPPCKVECNPLLVITDKHNVKGVTGLSTAITFMKLFWSEIQNN
jgi:hypothetical protein